jgi:hypothetical protein
MLKILKIISFLIISEISCIYRQETYKIFDKFNYADIVKYLLITIKIQFNTYKKQLSKKRCSIQDGPHCYHYEDIHSFEEVIKI